LLIRWKEFSGSEEDTIFEKVHKDTHNNDAPYKKNKKAPSKTGGGLFVL
jgi:hypothetical protein